MNTRRSFLRLCSLTGLGFACPGGVHSILNAAPKEEPPYEGPFYIVFNASGGWDTTYLMDPKGIGETNRLYKEGDILTKGAHKFAPTEKHKDGGMSNEEFFSEFGSEILTLNGLDYSVNNHGPGSRYMATGKLDSLEYPTFAALVAAAKGPTCPMSFLTFGNYSSTGNLVAMSRVPYLHSLQKLANAESIEGNARSPFHDDFALERIEQALEEKRGARAALPLLPRQDRAENMLYAAQVNSKAMQRITPSHPKGRAKRAPEAAGGDRARVLCGGRVRFRKSQHRSIRQPREQRP